MSKRFIIPIIMLAVFIIFNSCGKSPSGDVIQWKFGATLPAEGGGTSDWIKQYIETVKKKTDGRLVITPYWSETLGKSAEEVNLVQKGICDINYMSISTHPADFPLSSITELPYIMPGDRSLPILNQVFNKYFGKFFDSKNIHVLFPVWLDGAEIYTKKKPFKTLEDVKGMQLIVPPVLNFVQVVKAIKAIPVDVPPPEIYGALERGMADGGMGGLSILYAQKIYEQIKYVTITEMSCGIGAVCVNKDSWNKLPDDIKKIIEDLNKSEQQKFEDNMMSVLKDCISTFEKAGITVETLSKEEQGKFAVATKPIGDKWVNDMIKKGFPEVTDLRKELDSYRAGKK